MIGKPKARQIVLWVMAADFPLIYFSAVTIEDSVLTVIALVIMAAAAVAAGIVF
jgi:hypothetical protein